MKRFIPLGIAVVAIGAAIVFRGPHEPAPNPDPNHTHADFRILVDGQAIDFSGAEFMSEAPVEGQRYEGGALKQYLHLHDGIGHVIHRHKPGLTLQDFFDSIHVGFTANCLIYTPPIIRDMECSDNSWRMIVNGQERPMFLDYDFVDGDKILLTTTADQATLESEWEAMSDDACLYSQTCPWRGKPPAENCIADPEVPCVALE